MKTYSDEYPQIRRLQGVILVPWKIEEIEKPSQEGTASDVPDTGYMYDLIRVRDRGQQIEDRARFIADNYADLRAGAYGTWEAQLDMQFHGTWQAHVEAVKAMFPKPVE